MTHAAETWTNYAEAPAFAFASYAEELLVRDGDGKVTGIVGGTPVICDQYGVRIHPAGLGHWWYKRRPTTGLPATPCTSYATPFSRWRRKAAVNSADV